MADIAFVDAREQRDTVELEVVQCALHFGERIVDVGQRQRGESAEPVRPAGGKFGEEVVALACEVMGLLRVAEINSGR